MNEKYVLNYKVMQVGTYFYCFMTPRDMANIMVC